MVQSKMDINNIRVIDQSGNSMMLGYYKKEGDGHIVLNDFDIRMEDFNRYVDGIMVSSRRDANAAEDTHVIKVDLVERLMNTAVYSSAFTAFVIFSISIWTLQLANSIHNLSCA